MYPEPICMHKCICVLTLLLNILIDEQFIDAMLLLFYSFYNIGFLCRCFSHSIILTFLLFCHFILLINFNFCYVCKIFVKCFYHTHYARLCDIFENLKCVFYYMCVYIYIYIYKIKGTFSILGSYRKQPKY